MAGGGDPKWQKDAADQNFDYMFKLLIIGNSSVGTYNCFFSSLFQWNLHTVYLILCVGVTLPK